MQKKAFRGLGLVLLTSCVLFSQSGPDRNQPVFYFGEKQVYIGMSRQDAMAALSHCCKLSPPLDSDIERQLKATDSYFILLKEGSKWTQLGAIYFSGGKVVRLSRELAPNVDQSNENLVAFTRAFKRGLPEGSKSAVVSVRHKPGSNADFDVLTIVFANGQGIELTIVTSDTPNISNGRDFVNLEETL